MRYNIDIRVYPFIRAYSSFVGESHFFLREKKNCTTSNGGALRYLPGYTFHKRVSFELA